jgi:hypothetical protein
MKWQDHPENPLILPLKRLFRPKIVGDPTVLSPKQAIDNKWHMWANSLPGLYHYTSEDGIKWEIELKNRSMKKFSWGTRCSILKQNSDYFLYFEEVHLLGRRNKISVTHSTDLYNWSKPKVVLEQDLPWERQSWITKTLECPGIAYHPIQQKYYLFYSSGMVPLKGVNVKLVVEPTHIGLAVSDDPLGPFVKRKNPLLQTDPNDQWHNYGAGAMQCYWINKLNLLVGFNNGVFRRETDKGPVDGSAIMIYTSKEGKDWSLRTEEPILKPNDNGRFKWKDALVYQMGLTTFGDTYYLYYNARSKKGIEYIGLATCPVNEVHEFLKKT